MSVARGPLLERAAGNTVLYESEATLVTVRRAVDGSASIHKEALGQGALERTRHEARILRRLAGLPGVPELTADCGPDEIVMTDAGGRTLAELIDSAADPTGGDHRVALQLALDLAGVLAAVHRAGVLHGDVNPRNVLITRQPGTGRPLPTLIDFHLASTFAHGVPGFGHHRRIVGTLPYLAPEQTGRVGGVVDERADLYGLGATLYELLTGEPPFPVTEPLAMVHNTLTRIPVPPVEHLPGLPRLFSDIVLMLLEKEPDRRYQSADGLAHDLARLLADLPPDPDRPFALGERDFPRVLRPPARLVGREAETEALRAGFGAALTGGGSPVMLVSGSPGVGKSALINQLRSTVTERGGLFVVGKYDQYRQDMSASAVVQILGSLARLLLAGTADEVAAVRARILGSVGQNLEFLQVLPDFAALLDRPPTALAEVAVGEAREATARQIQMMVDLLRAVASPEQPLVLFLDDVQWAGLNAIRLMDALVRGDGRLQGLFLVGAYRDGEIEPTHPLTMAMERWEALSLAPTRIHLDDLTPTSLGDLLGAMLRLPAEEADELAAAVGERTGGNPFDAVELVNGLRRAQALVLGTQGWHWDARSIHTFLGDTDVMGLVSARIDRLPVATVEVLEMLAALGGEVTLDLLAVATGRHGRRLSDELLPALEEGFLELGRDGIASVRFRHDRLQQLAHGRGEPTGRRERQLAMARRLAPATEAAELYLHVVEDCGPDVLNGPDEARQATELFVRAAAGMRILDLGVAERLAGAAMRLVDGGALADDLRPVVERLWHAVLCDRSRFADADAIYARIEGTVDDPVELADPTGRQVSSLTARGRFTDAVEVGLRVLRQLGLDVPSDDLGSHVVALYAATRRWAASLDVAADLRRPDATDPRIVGIARVINDLVPASYFCGRSVTSWLVLTSCRLWEEHGPLAVLAGSVSCLPPVATLLADDYRIGRQVVQHVLAVAEARGYEPQTARVRHLDVLGSRHWFEPLEDGETASRSSREGLVQGGDLQEAAFTFMPSLSVHLDCAPSLETGLALADAGIAFCAQVGHHHVQQVLLAFRQLVRALRGETLAPGCFDDAGFEEAGHLAGLTGNPLAAAYFHVYRALAAALFGDDETLIRQVRALGPLQPILTSMYPFALVQLCRGLALARQLPGLAAVERATALAELDACQSWMDSRAADAPDNFEHLASLLRAERAWVEGDRWAAVSAFDAARRQAQTVPRPWHQALIVERAALFHTEQGLRAAGRELLAEARSRYAAWCADGKVRQLDSEHPHARTPANRHRSGRSSVSTTTNGSADAVDLMAVVRSSQALGSETSLSGLRVRVGEVLGAMTGATGALLALRADATAPWQVWDTTGARADSVSLADAGALLPLSAFRYTERTAAPLVIDSGADERFAADPYIAGRTRLSMLLVPLMGRGVLRGVLVLENRSRVGAFADNGLDAVLMVSGQLVASLENAQLYASLERKVTERTQALQEANNQLEVLSLTDALTGLPNRRHFDLLLESEFERARRTGRPLGLVMADVDCFKAFNDHYGHPVGDECLRRVAQALRGTVRQSVDAVCRYGGEEFALLFPAAEEATVRLAADRARAAVEALAHPHDRSPHGIVTVSMGVAWTVPDDRAGQLVQRADAGLYAAKENGRNQIG